MSDLDYHELGILTFLLLGVGLMFLPNAIRIRRKDRQPQPRAISKPRPWQMWLAVLAFLQAVAFVAIAIACESAGTHWGVGLICVVGSLLCSTLVLALFGLRPRHFLS